MMCHANRARSEVRAVSPRTGRPKLENAKKARMSLKFSKDEAELLQECAERMRTSRTQVIIKGIKLVRAELDSHEGK